MSGNSAKVREKTGKRPKIREGSGNLCSQGNLIVAAQQNNCTLFLRLRNDLYCVGWGVKLYSLTHSLVL